MPQQSALDYIRSGQTPFFRLPCADPHGLTGVDAALIGVTFDAGTTYQPGTRLAPYHLRRVSALLQPVHPVQGLDVFERVRTVDAGNVAFPPFEPGAMREAVQRDVAAIAGAGAVPSSSGETIPSRCPSFARSRRSMARSRSCTWTPTSTPALRRHGGARTITERPSGTRWPKA